jgi:hypothetical protein
LAGIAACLVFLTLLSLAVGSRSHWLDVTLVCIVWTAFVIGSIVVVVRIFKSPGTTPSAMGGQIALLPRRWRRWILDEQDQGRQKESR